MEARPPQDQAHYFLCRFREWIYCRTDFISEFNRSSALPGNHASLAWRWCCGKFTLKCVGVIIFCPLLLLMAIHHPHRSLPFAGPISLLSSLRIWWVCFAGSRAMVSSMMTYRRFYDDVENCCYKPFWLNIYCPSIDVIKGQNPCMEARPSQDESGQSHHLLLLVWVLQDKFHVRV